jgi:DNA (cytosine-5)-methyltransferase 1
MKNARQSMPDTPNTDDGALAASPQLNVLSLFAGIGGLELGLERAGMTVVGQVEIDPYCRRVLAKHWPEVPRHDDVRTASRWWLSRPRPRVDVVAGGFPCQPVSEAGHKLATEDERWLWPQMAAVIRAIGPTWVIGENVPGLLRRGLADVHADLERAGYRVRTGSITACAMGAPHPRERLFILAHTDRLRCDRRTRHIRQTRRNEPTHRTGWPPEPDVARVAHGVPAGVDRRRALGNAVVPAVAEHIGRLITGVAA